MMHCYRVFTIYWMTGLRGKVDDEARTT